MSGPFELHGRRGRPRLNRYRPGQLSLLNAPNVDLSDSKSASNAHSKAGVPHAGPPSRCRTYADPTRGFTRGNELHFRSPFCAGPEFCEFFEILGGSRLLFPSQKLSD